MNAQDLTSKKGELFLPEAGEYSLGIDAAPLLDYFGNFFGKSDANNAPVFQPNDEIQGVPGGFMIYGKMMKNANTAYRLKARIGLNNTNDRSFVMNIADPALTVEDEFKTKELGVALGIGLEKRRGSTRLQGIYGGELMLGFGTSSSDSIFGNNIDDYGAGATRQIGQKNGSTFMVGLNGFVGIEYFFAPKISVGGEYTWGVSFSNRGDGEVTNEFYDGSIITTQTSKSGGNDTFSLDTGVNGSASLKLLFYF